MLWFLDLSGAYCLVLSGHCVKVLIDVRLSENGTKECGLDPVNGRGERREVLAN